MKPQTISLKLDLRIISLILLVIIAAMLAMWHPWSSTATTRKITINGEATVKAVPDEFVFYPSFERQGTDTAALKNDLNTYGTKLQTELKALGVNENDITLNSSSYRDYPIAMDTTTDTEKQTVTLQVTITVPTKELAQKVQDYLAKTDAKGTLTSQPQFSETKRKEIENTARQQAIEDARKKANQTVGNLDAKLGKVLEVNDASGFDILPMAADSASGAKAAIASLPVTAGKQSVSVTVQVIFALK